MSNYTAAALDPITGLVRPALWVDDHFGQHRHGVTFDEGFTYHRPEEVQIPTDRAFMAISLEQAEEGIKSGVFRQAEGRDPAAALGDLFLRPNTGG